MEGFSILKTSKIQAMLQASSGDDGKLYILDQMGTRRKQKKKTTTHNSNGYFFSENNLKSLELDMLETGEIVLPTCEPEQNLQILVPYEGSYTEFEYRVSNVYSWIDFCFICAEEDKLHLYKIFNIL